MMDETKARQSLGKVCMFLGGLFILLGIGFFVANNRNNLYGKRVSATVLSSVTATTSDEKKITIMEVMYPVGDKNITTTYQYPGELKEGEVFLNLYYDARNPKVIIQAGWTFEALFLALLGAVIFLLGLYYAGITDFGIVEMKKPDESAPERVKRTYEAKEKIGNGLFPTLGGLVFVAFGIVMLVTRKNNWMWIFIGIGLLVVIYSSFEMVPAIFELRQLNMAKKFKGEVVDPDAALNEKDKKKKSVKDTKEVKEEDDLLGEDFIKEMEESKKKFLEKDSDKEKESKK